MVKLLSSLLSKFNVHIMVGLFLATISFSGLWMYERSQHQLTISKNEIFIATLKGQAAEQQARIAEKLKQSEKINDDIYKSSKISEAEIHEYYKNNPNHKYIYIPNRVRNNEHTSANGMSEEVKNPEVSTGETNGDDKTTTSETSGKIQIDREKLENEIVRFLELQSHNEKQDAVED